MMAKNIKDDPGDNFTTWIYLQSTSLSHSQPSIMHFPDESFDVWRTYAPYHKQPQITNQSKLPERLNADIWAV